jgi:hypothetical protein
MLKSLSTHLMMPLRHGRRLRRAKANQRDRRWVTGYFEICCIDIRRERELYSKHDQVGQ